MAQFMICVEIFKPSSPKVYAAVHDKMVAGHFSQLMESGGVNYKLPTGVFTYDGLKSDSEILVDVNAIVKGEGHEANIVVINVTRAPKHNLRAIPKASGS